MTARPFRPWRRLGAAAIAAAALAAGIPLSAQTAGSESVGAFLDEVNARLLELGQAAARAGWVAATYITVDTERISADAAQALSTAQTEYARRAAGFRDAAPRRSSAGSSSCCARP